MVPDNKELVDNNFFNFLSLNNQGATITNFVKPLTLTISLSSSILSNYQKDTLDLYKHTNGEWVAQNCSLNSNQTTLICNLNSFSVYGLFGKTIIRTFSAPAKANADSCTDKVPTVIPELFEINLDNTSATLFFTPSDASSYFISFSQDPSAMEHGALFNLSREGVQSATVNYLNPNTIYFFKVRADNGCAPGEWSNILMAKTSLSKFTTAKYYLYYSPLSVTQTKTPTSSLFSGDTKLINPSQERKEEQADLSKQDDRTVVEERPSQEKK